MINTTTLDNGLRVITEQVTYVESVALGFWIGAGAKHEKPEEFGLSHFLEHMMFKGTERRSAKDIAEEIAGVGGQMNAATDREYTTYYAKFMKEHTALAVDVLADMLLNSVFDPEEMSREKDVIAEEIRRHEDMPEERVHDIAAEITWGKHRLGHGVLGLEEVVKATSRDTLIDYRDRHYLPDSIVVSAAGNLEHEEIAGLVGEYFGGLTGRRSSANGFEPVVHHNAHKVVDKDTEAVYFCIGAPGYAEMDDRKYTLSVLDTILGGGMSSRLFQEVREKRGLAYDIGSYRVSYQEGGMFAIYGGTGVDTLGSVMDIVSEELRKARELDVCEKEFVRAQMQIKGALLLSQESMGARMGRMGKGMLDYGRHVSVEEVIGKILSVKPGNVREAADELLKEDGFSMAFIGPAKDVERVLNL